MTAFVWTFFVLFILEIGFIVAHTSADNYPRLKTKGDDLFSLVQSIGFVFWAAYLLFWMKP